MSTAVLSMFSPPFFPILFLAFTSLSFALLSAWLVYKVRSLRRERDRLRTENGSDGKILFLQSRYASMEETVGNIAHQWKQPLNAIGSILNGVKAAVVFQGDIPRDKLLTSVETSFRLLRHLSETIDTFYGFLSQRHADRRSFRVSEELETIRKITGYSFENSRISLRFLYDADPLIEGNAGEFTHAMLNLILNAKDALDNAGVENPEITVRVAGGEERCTITVEDNGGGIRLDPPELIFELHVSTKEEGSGMGLFMTRNIIEKRFGGTIAVANTAEGALFTITLPLREYGEYAGLRESIEEKRERLNLQWINRLANRVLELEEAKKSLTRWADIFHHAHWGIAIHLGTSDTFERVNPAFEALYGYTPKEIKSISVPDLFAPESLPILQRVQAEAFERGYAVFEALHRRRDGSTFPVQIELIVVKNDEGEVLYHIANVWDQSEKKAAEERLLLKRFALDHIKDAVFLIDEDARFHYANKGASNALGYTPEELMGMSVGDVDPDWPNERWSEHWEALKKAGSMTMELRHRRKDGSIFPVEVSANYIEFGGKHYNMAIARDITERRLLEEEKKNRVIKTVAENSPDVIIRYDVEGRRVYANPKAAELLGVEVGKSPSEATPIIEKELYVSELQKVIQTGTEATFEITYTNVAGGIDYSHIRMVPEFDDNGSISSVLMIGRNVTDQKLAFDALAQKERELRALAESSPGMVGAYYMRPDGSVCMPYVSPNVYELFGITPEEIKEDATRLMALNHPDDAEMVVRTIEESAQNMSLWHIEYRIIHPTKGVRWMEGNTMPQPHPDGGVVWYGYVHDITERKRMEISLEKHRLSLAEAQKLAKLGSWELELPSQKLTWSDETYRIFEIDPDKVDNLHTVFYDYVHPEDREMVQQVYENSLATQTPFELMHRIILPDGRIKYVLEACETKYDAEGHPILSLGTVQDVTDRKLIEKELEDSHAFLTKLIDSLPDPIFVKDREHKWLILNKANYEFAGIEPGTLIGKSDYDVFPKAEADVFWAKDEEVFTSGRVNVNEEYFTSADGVTHYIQTVKAMFTGSDGKEYLVGTIRDLSERKAMEDELRKALEFNDGVIGAIPDLLFEIAPDSTYVGIWAQDETLLAAQKEMLLGNKFQDILPPDAVEASFAAMREVDEKGFSVGKTFSLDLPNGKRWFELSLSKKKTSGNYIALSRDVTERKQAEDTIIELNNTLEEKVKERTLQLQQALEFSNGIINALPDPLFELDINGTYLNVWAGDEELLAAQKELISGHTLHEILSEESADTVMEALREADARGTSFGKIIKIDLQHGTRYFEESVSRKSSTNTFLVLSRDITERVEADKKLQESEETFRAIVENSPDVISRYDLQMRRTYVNPMMQFLLGKPVEEILGKTPREFSPLPDVELFEEIFETVVRGGSEMEYEGAYLTPWGEKRWGNQRIVPEFDAGHNVVSVMVIGRDMTERKETEKRIMMVETAVNSSTEAIYINDKSLSIIYVNDGACRMLGYSRNELLGMKIYDIDALFARDEIHDLRDGTLSDGQMFFETKHRKKDGTVIDVSISGTPFVHEGEEIILSVVKDITEQKKAEKQLKLLDTAINNADEAVYIVDDDRTILYVSDAAERMLGYTRSELIGTSVYDLDAGMSKEEIDAVKTNLETTHALTFETKHRAKDGHDVDVEITVTSFHFGHDHLRLSLVKDISERKALEKTLHFRERYQRTLLDNFPYFVWLKDRDSRLLAANEQYARVAKAANTAELEGKTDFDFFPHDLADKYVRDDREVMKEGKPKNVEEQYADEHDAIRWMETWKSPVWVNGEIVGTVGCSRDITERKMMEQALRESESRYREIFENASDMIYLLEVLGEDRYRYLALNRAFESIIGAVRDELIGRIAGQKLPPESARVMNDQYNRCVREARTIEATSILDVPAGRKTFLYTLIPITDDAQKVRRILVLAKAIA